MMLRIRPKLPVEILARIVEEADPLTRLAFSATNRTVHKVVRGAHVSARREASARLQQPPLTLTGAESARFVDALYLNAALHNREVNGERLCCGIAQQNQQLFCELQTHSMAAIGWVAAPSRTDPVYRVEALSMIALCAAGIGVLVLDACGRPALGWGTQAVVGAMVMSLPPVDAPWEPARPVSARRFLGPVAGWGYMVTALVALYAHASGCAFLLSDPEHALKRARIAEFAIFFAYVIAALRQWTQCTAGIELAVLSFTHLGKRPAPQPLGPRDFLRLRDAALWRLANDPPRNQMLDEPLSVASHGSSGAAAAVCHAGAGAHMPGGTHRC